MRDQSDMCEPVSTPQRCATACSRGDRLETRCAGIAASKQWHTVALFVALALAASVFAEEPDQQRSKTIAVLLWTGLAILSVTLLGIGLVWGVARAARMIRKRREPVHTDMPDIWFLNPPGKRKQDES